MNIIELAREAGIDREQPYLLVEYQEPWNSCTDVELERFAALVRAQTLEEAARVCENTLAQHYMKQVIPTHDQALLLAACADCAGAIQALKEKT